MTTQKFNIYYNSLQVYKILTILSHFYYPYFFKEYVFVICKVFYRYFIKYFIKKIGYLMDMYSQYWSFV